MKKGLVETMLHNGYPKQVIADAVLETYQATGELPGDSFVCGLHARKVGGWFLLWDRPGRKGPAPYIKEVTL